MGLRPVRDYPFTCPATGFTKVYSEGPIDCAIVQGKIDTANAVLIAAGITERPLNFPFPLRMRATKTWEDDGKQIAGEEWNMITPGAIEVGSSMLALVHEDMHAILGYYLVNSSDHRGWDKNGFYIVANIYSRIVAGYWEVDPSWSIPLAMKNRMIRNGQFYSAYLP